MNDIQKARDVLAKHRSYAGTAQDWALRGGTSRLIRIAADPDLLDAIDGLLELAIEYGALPTGSGSRFSDRANHVAAAIIAADERMQQ